MKLLALLGTAAAFAVAAPASAAVIVTDYNLTFTNGTAFIVPEAKTAVGEYRDIFTFVLPTAVTFSGSLSTQRLFDENGAVVSDLDFGNSEGGVFLDTNTAFGNPQPGDGLEVVNLTTTRLAAGTHKLTVNYTVNTASADPGAVYSGSATVARVAAVPEPATWAMFVGAFGAIGASLRQRRRSAVTFA